MGKQFYTLCTTNKLDDAISLYNNSDDIDLGFAGSGGNTALSQCSHKGHEAVVEWLIKAGSPLDNKNTTEMTALMNAAAQAHAPIVKSLLTAGADINIVDKTGKSAVIHALNSMTVTGKAPKDKLLTEVVFALIKAGTDLNTPDKTGKTALDYAAKKNMQEVIAQYSSVTESPCENGESQESVPNFLMQGISSLELAINKNNIDAVQYFINEDKNIGNPDYMVKALQHGSAKIIKILLNAGFDLNKKPDGLFDKDDREIFYYAMLCKKITDIDEFMELQPLFLESVHMLSFVHLRKIFYSKENLPNEFYTNIFKKWDNINKQDANGETLLHYAVRFMFDDWVEALINYDGINLNMLSFDKISPAYCACTGASNEPEVLRKLSEAGAERNVTHGEGYKTPEVLRSLLKAGANVNVLCDETEEPLILSAAHYSKMEHINVLLEFGGDINCADKNGCTPLHIACIKNDLELCKFLLSKNADAAAVDKNGDTPLHLLFSKLNTEISHHIKAPRKIKATYNMYKELVDALLDAGSDINALNDRLRNPFFEYCYDTREFDSRTVTYLIEKGSQVDLQDVDERDILYYAAKAKNINLESFLKEHMCILSSVNK